MRHLVHFKQLEESRTKLGDWLAVAANVGIIDLDESRAALEEHGHKLLGRPHDDLADHFVELLKHESNYGLNMLVSV